jgi:hypothetical protein
VTQHEPPDGTLDSINYTEGEKTAADLDLDHRHQVSIPVLYREQVLGTSKLEVDRKKVGGLDTGFLRRAGSGSASRTGRFFIA